MKMMLGACSLQNNNVGVGFHVWLNAQQLTLLPLTLQFSSCHHKQLVHHENPSQ
jgi:hypothetical protein